MEALYARYPFLDAAREAVEAADVDLSTVVAEDPPVVERALDRVLCAIEDGTTGEPHRSSRVELLSYPVARVLVSLVGEPGLTRRYAHAEARTAYERVLADVAADGDAGGLRSVEPTRIDLGSLLGEFDLAGSVERTGDGFRVGVGVYLELAADRRDDRWHLVNRALAEGAVPVAREEFFDLLREAICDRIEDGLPLDVPDAVAGTLSESVAELRDRLADHAPARDFDEVDPELFPPCVQALLDRAGSGESLPPHSRFTLTSFLATVGMETDEIAGRYAADGADGVRYQIAHLRDDDGPATYPPPSCLAMESYGDCVNKDALCGRIAHPLEYYERRLDGDDPADYAPREESQ